ncbi:MAG TPA: acetylxylan esterase [Terracidiphilus sp.]|nr:acetylxylan esterase [Terracidiphilus sp.]
MNSIAARIARTWVVIIVASAVAAQPGPQDSFLNWMNGIAQRELQQRAQTIRAIHSVDEAESRKQFVRKQLLDDMGGLPDYKGPLNARVTGEIRTESYTIEKVIYESLPGFYVTANLYRPNARGRYPAVLLQAGHTQEGKPENQRVAANLALKGFVVLCFDPIGQGEREQTFSRQVDLALAGWSVPEHIIMEAQAELIGQGLARYFIWDAMRSIDYLASRPDVDSSRIGAAGCSGGGALTTFIGALDRRVKVVIPACYPSSFKTMFVTAGPHGEMTFPGFLASGLDTADFVELSAPTPWLLQANETDQFGFSHEGVHLVYEEAQDWYDLYHARDKVGFMIGPGSHGMPLVSRDAVYEWMIRYLKNGEGDAHEQPVKMFSNGELMVTQTGHVEDLPGSHKLFEILNSDLQAHEKKGTIDELRAKLASLGIPTEGSAPKVTVKEEQNGANGSQQHIEIESEPGIWLDATLYVPASAVRKPAVLIVKDDEKIQGMPLKAMAEKMAGLGRVVLVLEPRTSQIKNYEGSYTGDWISDMQANLIGRNLPAMRAHDILRGLDLLRARPDVDPNSIRGTARGVAGIWLLLAAAADPRLNAIWLDKTPYSLRAALRNSVTSDLSDAVIPGFALNWDVDDLVKAVRNRQVLWTDPTNWVHGVTALGPPFRYRYVPGDLTDEVDLQEDNYIREFLQ